MKMGPVDYTSHMTPTEYRCSKCGEGGVKLWRQYQTFADHIDLLCVVHALEDQNLPGPVDEKGRHHNEHGHGTDPIGWLVPAVPTAEGDTYWGYTSVPEDGVQWWRRLPTYPREPLKFHGFSCFYCGKRTQNCHMPEWALFLERNQACHTCGHWIQQHGYDMTSDRLPVIIYDEEHKHRRHYCVSKEHLLFKGTNGDFYDINGNHTGVRKPIELEVTGRTVYCLHLAHQGIIPERFYDWFAVNARIVSGDPLVNPEG